MTGVKLAKVFVILLMVLLGYSEQTAEEQHLIYPATDEVHFTTNAHEYHEGDLKERYRGKRMVPGNEYQGGATNDNRHVIFHSSPNLNIADVNLLTYEEKGMLNAVIESISAQKIFVQNAQKIFQSGSSQKGFRLDMQGIVNNLQHGTLLNLQVQKNGGKKPGTSSTYAAVLVPQNANGVLGDRVIRNAFYYSLRHRAIIRLEIGNKVVQKPRPGQKG